MAFSFGLFAAPVTLESARSLSDNFYRHYSAKSNFTISDEMTYQKNGVNTFYVFIYAEGGFVLVSADDAVTPILGYSTNESFDKNNIPVNAANWFNQYSNHIKYIIDSNLSNKSTIKEWNKIRNNEFSQAKQAVVTPLCTTTWDQSSPYNNLCPSSSMTGCVATAMAQIMKYWNYPTTGTGSHTYTEATYGSLTANFGTTTYGWANMPNNLTSSSTAAQKTAVSTLMYHCGVSVDMAYSPSGSGAYSTDVPPSLINYFNYSPSAEIQFLANFTSANWIAMLKAELDVSRPVYYSGTGAQGGHAFVCDGYNASNQFHFNWGWSGMANGYFAIGSLNPIGDDFNSDNSAVTRIKPISNAPVANFVGDNHTPAVGAAVNFTDLSTNSPTSWSWVFDGGTPSTSTLQHPTNIVYSTAGLYQVTLTATNADGSDTKIRASYIDAGGTPSAWIKQNTGLGAEFRGIDQIAIVNPYIVWAKAYDGSGGGATIQEYIRTTNGGISWTADTITADVTLTDYGIANLHPFNDTVCIAAMYPAVAANGGYIIKTINGGATWSSANTPNFTTAPTNSWLDMVHFFNANDGVCIGDPNAATTAGEYIIYTTSNGGTTWTQVPVANIPNCTANETSITGLFDAVHDTIWFGTTKGRLYRSINKGLNWTVSVTGLGTSAVVTPRFKNGLVGEVTGTGNASPYTYLGMKKTIDGGLTWTAITPTGFYVKSPNLDYVPGTANMWVDCSASLSSATTNPGSSYSLNDCTSFLDIDTGSVQYTTVTFYDINTGWAGGFTETSGVSGIYKWDPSILTSIPQVNPTLSDEIKVYPNPTQDIVNIEFTVVPNTKVEVNLYNVLGENVLSKVINSNTNIAQLNLSGNKSGIYLLTIDNGSKRITKRISLVE